MAEIDLSQLQDWLGKRFDAIDVRFNKIETRLDELEEDIIDGFNMMTRLFHLDAKLRRRVDAHEARIKALEEHNK